MQNSMGLARWLAPLQMPYNTPPFIFLLFLLRAGGVCACERVRVCEGGFPINPSLPLINFHLESEPGWPQLEWYPPLEVAVSPSGVTMRGLWGSFSNPSCPQLRCAARGTPSAWALAPLRP